MAGREDTSDWLFCLHLANVNLRIANYVDDGVNKVVRRKEGLKTLSRFPSAVSDVTGNERNNERTGCESARRSPTANRLGPASEIASILVVLCYACCFLRKSDTPFWLVSEK